MQQEKPEDGSVAIGREHFPDLPRSRWFPRSLFISPAADRLLPQVATINGTVLSVGARQCDLATARAVWVRTEYQAILFGKPGDHDYTLLEASPNRMGPSVALVITVGPWSLLLVEHLRLLAGILSKRRTWRPGTTEVKARHAITFLLELADRIEKGQLRDWSFRAGPMGDRRESPGKYV